ncbi:MAG: sigma-70 family RNA polymerase sigma factor [Ruminococcaceae bacterium]|nr:sigma-70 family RNA polymerase sigma factor [Oscillospiraceae bacterium]
MEKYYLKYKNDVFRFALSIVKDIHIAEDITQESFLKLFQNNDKIRDRAKIKTWLFTTARNLSITALKKDASIEFGDKTDYTSKSGDEYDLKYFEIISALSQEEQQLISLRIIGKFKWKEIAEILDCSEEAIKKRYQRSLDKLKTAIKEV